MKLHSQIIKREEPDANRIIVIRLKTLGSYTNIQIGSTYTDLNDYSYFYTLHDIENYYVYDRAKFTYLIDKSKVIFKQRLIDDIDKPFKYVSIELLEGHYIDDLSLNALKNIFRIIFTRSYNYSLYIRLFL